MGYLKSIGTGIIYIGFFLAVITFLPGLPPEAEFYEYSLKAPADFPSRLEYKNRLQGAEILFPGEIKGPEYFASYNGELYTGIGGGYVVKIEENRIVPVVKFGKKCDGLWQEEKCGRPLGLQFNSKGDLFVADSYYGIFKVNVNTRQYTNIVNSSIAIDGKTPKIVNSLDIAKNGDIYWTDSSSDFSLQDGSYTYLANPSGRLIRYNALTKKNEVLLKNLGFANGVLLSDDESFLIVAECLTARITKYHLKGPKAGKHEIFVEALPGLPDNVHSDGQGGFLVSLVLSIEPDHPFLCHSLAPHPYLRKMVARLFYLIEAPFKLLQDVYPNFYAERVLYSVGSFSMAKSLDTKQTSLVLRIDKSGNILDALNSADGKVHDISSAYIHNGYLWLGSPWNEYIMRIPLKQAFPDLADNTKSSRAKRETEEEPIVTVTGTPNIKVSVKPTKTKPVVKETITAKPTTTTPKPTTAAPKPATTTPTPKPTTTTPKPTTTAPKPTTTVPKPTTTAPKPTTTAPKPTTTAPKPTTTAPKPTTTAPKPQPTKKPVVDASASKSSQQKPATQTTTTKTPSSSAPSPPKAAATEGKDTSKEVKKDNVREAKKVNSNSNINAKPSAVKTESVKKNEAPAKPKSDESVKKNVREAQPEKSKTAEKKSDSTKK